MADFSNIIQEINTNLPDNNTQAITAEKLRTTLIDLTDTISDVQDDFEEGINTTVSNLEGEIENIDVNFNTGQPVSSVDIINDFTTGGVDNVSSAESVKILNDNLNNYGVFPLKDKSPEFIFVPASGNINANGKSLIIKATSSDTVKIRNAGGTVLYYSFLTSYPVVGELTPFVPGTGRTTVNSTSTDLITLTIPNGTNYIVLAKSLSNDYILGNIIVNGIDLYNGLNQTVSNLSTDVSNLSTDVSNLSTEVDDNFNTLLNYSDKIIEMIPDNYLFYFKPRIGYRYNSTGVELVDTTGKYSIINPTHIQFDCTFKVKQEGFAIDLFKLNSDGTLNERIPTITTSVNFSKGDYVKFNLLVRGTYDYTLTEENIYDYFEVIKNESVRWLALGDSITYGVYSYPDGEGSGSSTDASKTYVARLQELLGYNLTNKGIGGMGWVQRSSSSGRTWNLKEQLDITNPSTETEIRFYVDAADYDLITIFLGVNDWKQPQQTGSNPQATLQAVEDNMKYCFDKLIAENQNIKIIVFSPINSAWEISSNPSTKANQFAMNYSGGYNGYTMNTLVAKMKEVCESYGIEFHDMLHNSIINICNIGGNTTLLPDNVHPSLEAHKLIAEDMYRFMGKI